MKRILIRTGMLPTDCFRPEDFIKENLMGGNIGNFLYVYGILRNIVTNPDCRVDSTYYKTASLDADYINENYDCFIIPLADAFRDDFVVELDKLTALVKSLKIPCYVIGAGLRDEYEPTFKNGFSFDENVKSFINAVLEKSTIIGVRGQITADYLTHLGFKEGRDHIPIGCPSMYTYGPNLRVSTPKITGDSRISINTNIKSPEIIKDFLRGTVKEIPDYTFVPQSRAELKYVYTGVPFKIMGKHIPIYTDSPLFEGNHIKFFLNIKSWLDYFDDVDLSVGSRLHGNIAALLSGTPAIFITKDARERELDDFHHFNSFPFTSLTKSTTIWELIEKSDFSKFEKYQLENYKIFNSFLDLNKLEHNDQTESSAVSYDELIKDVKVLPPVKSFRAVSERERGERCFRVYAYTYRKPKKEDREPEVSFVRKIFNKMINSNDS